nr:RNA-directed DNA polymerase, eukaryota [Tanacetum cinerariifolium]
MNIPSKVNEDGDTEGDPQNKSPSTQNHADSMTPPIKPETKLISFYVFMVKSFWGNMLFNFATVSARELSRKRQLLAYMTGIIHHWHGEVITMGDFNEVRFASEQHGSSFSSSNATEFNSFIANTNLIDIPLGGYSFMWSGKYANKMSKLDRFLVSEEFEMWNKRKRDNDRCILHDSLLEIDSRTDKGEALPDDATKHDENSKFFHEIVNKKRRQQPIKGVLIDGEWIDNPARVKGEFYNHFANRFSHPDWDRISLEGCFSRTLNSDHSNALEEDVSSEEIKKAVWDYGFDKSPDDILDKFSFGSKWRGWICGCLTSSKASILVNGSPKNEFFFHRGLRQGDPLSPLLFILVMESLHVAFQRVIDRGMFIPILIGKDNLIPISHLFYADDAMFIGEWSSSNINVLLIMLHCFFLALGLQVNVHKSSRYGVCVPPRDIQDMAAHFGCMSNKLPFTYLGVKVGANMGRINSWSKVIQKVSNRLSKWKAKSLSVGGRLTLKKSVLGSIPTYYMSLFKAPISVISQLESLRNSFFLGEDLEDRKMTWAFQFEAAKKCLCCPQAARRLHQYLFSQMSKREEIDKNILIISSSPTRWSKPLPIKLNVFMCRMLLDKLPTRINLSSRGLDIPSVLFPNYDGEVETRNHLA